METRVHIRGGKIQWIASFKSGWEMVQIPPVISMDRMA